MEGAENEHQALPQKKAEGNEDATEHINDTIITAKTVKTRQRKVKKGPNFMYGKDFNDIFNNKTYTFL